MQKYRDELKLICNCSPDTRKLLFNKGSREFIKALVAAIWTTLAGRPLSYKNKELIRSKLNILRKIVAKNTSLKKRRRLLAS